jgi:hypothetical protein
MNVFISIEKFTITLSSDGKEKLSLSGFTENFLGYERISTYVSLYSAEADIQGVLDTLKITTGEDEYIERIKNLIIEKHSDGIVSYHTADNLNKEDFLGIDVLVSPESWNKIYNKISLSPHLKITMSSSINDDYKKVLNEKSVCSIFSLGFNFSSI